ncbi:hypothetical protein BH10ACT3_BH10ACT3_19420 [soil metagenome]
MGAKHRASAIAALVCLTLAVATLAVGTVLGMPELLAPMVLVILGVWLTWRALTRRGLRRRIYGVIAGVVWLAAVLGVVWGGVQVPLLALSVVLFVVGGALSSRALSWVHHPAGRLVERARHPVLIVNPHSGDGVAEKTGLIDEARQRNIKVVELGENDDLAHLARREARRGADCIGMAGGDGSLAIVADVAIRHHIPFVCIPAGTRNHFALDLGLDRSDPVAALDAFNGAVQRRIDTATVNDRMFLNNVSIGAYGEVVASEEYRDNKVGVTLDRIPDLIGPDAEPLDLRFTDHEGTVHDSAVVIHVSNNSYDLGPLGFGSRASLEDGALGIVAVAQANDGRGHRPKVMQWQARTFTVRSGSEISAGVDGESVELHPTLEFRIHPHELRVRIPCGVAGVSPAGKRPPLTVRTILRLTDVARGIEPRSDLPARG